MNERLTAHDLDIIIHNGENDQIEFKYGTLVSDVLAKCIAAFANAKGGKIIIGYSERRRSFVNSSWKDQHIIEKALVLLEDPPKIEIYNVEYKEHLLLIVDVEQNEGKLTYYQGALYKRVADENQLMDKNSIKSAFTSISKYSDIELLIALEKMNVRNEELRNKIDEHNSWAIKDSRKGFRWAIAFCVAGAILGAAIGTILSKWFLV
jgi:predicted HTH transcriptional regulator